jgi:hypothetical protein
VLKWGDGGLQELGQATVGEDAIWRIDTDAAGNVYTGSWDGKICQVDCATLTRVRETATQHRSPVVDLQVMSDGVVYGLSRENQLTRWDARTRSGTETLIDSTRLVECTRYFVPKYAIAARELLLLLLFRNKAATMPEHPFATHWP